MATNVLQALPGFSVIDNAEALQTATMTLEPGETSGPKSNEHPHSEQMLYVVEGSVKAEIADRTLTMEAGDSVIVRRGEPHRFSNAGSTRALTLNVYSPPFY